MQFRLRHPLYDRIRIMPAPDWPGHLDALAAAPNHHRLLFENDAVRVIETIIPPGDTAPLHTHRWPGTLHLLTWSDIVRRDASGAILMDSRTTTLKPANDTVTSTPALQSHSLENVGDTTFRAVTTELKHL